MARTASRPRATSQQTLELLLDRCAACGERLRVDYDNFRTLARLQGPVRLRLRIGRCHHVGCARFHKPTRPEAEGSIALPQHEFGLDVIAWVGECRYRAHRSVPEIHQALVARGLVICARSVTNLLDRYDELATLHLASDRRLQKITALAGRVILALDGLQPDVGPEVLWVLRDCLSGEVLLAKSLLSATQADLSRLIAEVRDALTVPIVAAVSDGQHSIRNAVRDTLPGVPHQLCHFHYLREAARPLYEMDRHAKKELKKQVRGVRALERSVEGRQDQDAQGVQGYCAAVRSALSDDGRPPLVASGLKLRKRVRSIHASLARVIKKGRRPQHSDACTRS